MAKTTEYQKQVNTAYALYRYPLERITTSNLDSLILTALDTTSIRVMVKMRKWLSEREILEPDFHYRKINKAMIEAFFQEKNNEFLLVNNTGRHIFKDRFKLAHWR